MATIRLIDNADLTSSGLLLSDLFNNVSVWWLLNHQGRWRITSQSPATIEIYDIPDDRLTKAKVVAIHDAGGVVLNWPCMIRIPITQADNTMPAFLAASEGGTRTWRSYNDLQTVDFPVIAPHFYVPATVLGVDSIELKQLNDMGTTILTMAEFQALQAT